jgi:hypothetical protein
VEVITGDRQLMACLIKTFGLLAAAAIALCGSPAGATDSPAPLPLQVVGAGAPDFPSQDVRVATDGATSGVLRVRFENLSQATRPAPRTWPAVFMIAGATGKQPNVTITRGHYYYVENGRITAETSVIPSTVDGPAPPQWFRITAAGRFRNHQVYGLSLTREVAATRNLGTAGYWMLDWADTEIDLGPPPTTAASTTDSFDPMVSPNLLNPQIDGAYLLPPEKPERWEPQREWAARVNTALAHGPVLKLSVYEPGVYGLDAATLHLPPSADDPSAWRLFHGGQEVPLVTDGLTSPSAALFSVPDFDVELKGADVYWLLINGGTDADTTPPLRIKPVATETVSEAMTSATSVRNIKTLVRSQEREQYNNRVRAAEGISRWIWKSMGDGEVGEFDVALPATYSADAATSVQLRAYFSILNPINGAPEMELIANGISMGLVGVQGTQGKVEFSIPSDAVTSGSNAFGLRLRYPASAVQHSEISIHRLDLTYGSPAASPIDGQTVFTVDGLTTEPASFAVAAPSPGAPQPLMFIEGRDDEVVLSPRLENDGMLRFSDPGGARQSYRLVRPDQPLLPHVELAQPFNLFTEANFHGDYLAVAHRSLMDRLKPLLDYRASLGHTVAAVDVDTVFDHFSYGLRDPAGLKDFFAYAFATWPASVLQKVLLVGEASDYKADPAAMPRGGQADMVPVFGNARVDTPHGDHWYALAAGTDGFVDLAVGRISVATPDELTSTIEKIIAYEKNPDPEWAMAAKFVMDDNEEFPRVVDNVIARAATPYLQAVRFKQSDYPYEPNTKVSARRRSRTATSALLEAWNEGVGTMTFFGHGGPNLWTHERLFHVAVELPHLQNSLRLPLLTCASCDNAWLDYPVPPVTVSMGELFLKNPNGGAIGIFAPVAGASPFEHQTLVSHMMDAIYRRNVRVQGDITVHAKNFYLAETMSTSLPEQFVLVGDPGTRLIIPPIHGGLSIEPTSVPANKSITTTASLDTGSSETFTAVLAIRSLESGDDLTSQQVLFEEGKLFTHVAVHLPVGEYAAVVRSLDRTPPLLVASRLSAAVPLPAIDTATTTPMMLNGEDPDDYTTVTIKVFNPTNVAMNNIRITAKAPADVESTTSPRVLFDTHADLAPLESLNAEFPWNSTMGDDLWVRAASGDNSLRTTTTLAPVILADSLTTPPVQLPPSAMRWTPEVVSSADTPTINFRLFNTTTGTLNNLRTSLWEKGSMLTEEGTVSGIPPLGWRDGTLALRAPLAEGRHDFELFIRPRDEDTSPSQRAANVGTSHTVVLNVLAGPDLMFQPDSVRVTGSQGRLTAQSTVYIHAQLHNAGRVEARSVALQLLGDDPKTGKEMQTINDTNQTIIASIAPDETVPVTFRWENARTAGGQPNLWLTINRTGSVRETSTENNAIAVPPFDLNAITNYTISSFNVTPLVGREGTSATLHVSAMSSGSFADGPVELETGFQNPLDGESRKVRHKFPLMEPNTPADFNTTLALHARMPVAFANINASRELEELDGGDNTTQTALQVVRALDKVPRVGNRYDFTTILGECTVTNMQMLPGGVLRPDDRFSHVAGYMPFDPDWVVDYPLAPEPAEEPTKDQRWTILPYLLAAQREERTTPILLQLPLPVGHEADIPLTLLGVTQFSPNYQGGRIGAMDVAVGAEISDEDTSASAFRRVDVPAGVNVESDQFIPLATDTWATTSVAVALRQPPTVGVRLAAFQYRLAAGVIESPLWEVPERDHGRTALLSAVGDFPSETKVLVAWRTGKWQGDHDIEWSAWSALQPNEAETEPLDDLLQWKLVAIPAPGNAVMPVISKVELTIK